MKKFALFICTGIFCLMSMFAFAGCDNETKEIIREIEVEVQPTTYTITATSNNVAYGTTYGSGTYTENETVSIYAVAKAGYEFESWNDGNTNAVRNVNVTRNQTFTAQFVKSKVYYSLDKVEMYVEAGNNFSAQTIGFQSFNISTKNNESDDTLYVCLQRGFAGAVSLDSLPLLCDAKDGAEHGNIVANSSMPYVFYAPRTSANRFEEGKTNALHYSFTRTCWKFVTTSDTTYEYEQLHDVVNPSTQADFNLTVTATTKTQTICICTDTDHDYCVYVRLNFVQL